jgi:adenine-specific DNA-methyltransferase
LLPQKHHLVMQRARALQTLVRKKPGGAARLALTILYLWQRESFPALVRRAPRPDKRLTLEPRVILFANWLSKSNLLDGAFWLSSAYALWVGEEVRTERAMFFTPPELSTRLINDLVRNKASLARHVWMDPASGGAAFLAPVAKRMASELRGRGMRPKAILKHIAAHLIGNDSDSTLASMSKQFLRMALCKEITETGFEPKFEILKVDALSKLNRYRNKVDVVICNPPYRKMAASEVSQYSTGYNDVIVGQPNLYGLFFKLALQLLKKGGIAGLVTPTSYMSGRYFSSLRTYLLKNADTVQLDIVTKRDGIFSGAALETVISILKKQKPKEVSSCKTRVFIFDKAGGFTSIGRCVLPNSGLAWPVPRDDGDAVTIRAVNGTPFRLKDYGYRARIGTFVWNRDQRETFRTAQRASRSRALFPLIWSSDIRQNGRLEFGRLQHGGEYDIFVDMERKDHSSVVRRPCVALQRVTSPEQPRRLVGAPVTRELLQKYGGVVGENHVVFLEQVDSKPLLSPSQLAVVLRSEPIDRIFRCIAGAINVSVFELNQLPLPNPQVLASLLRKGMNVNDAVDNAFRKQNSVGRPKA